jgi:biotin transport system substrate-specific component
MLVYLAIGALGFPVFAGGRAGLGTLSGPAGGYLIGFVLGAWITGFIARSHGFTRRHGSGGRRKPAPWLYLVAALCGGVVVVHTAGSLWLALSTGRTAGEAFALGSAPFLPGDLLKALGAVAVAARLYEATGSPWTRWR